jgi:hypothetical protein
MIDESKKSLAYNSHASQSNGQRSWKNYESPFGKSQSQKDWRVNSPFEKLPVTENQRKGLTPNTFRNKLANELRVMRKSNNISELPPSHTEITERRTQHTSHCTCDKSPRIQINIANDSKVEIKEEFDYLNRKLINISIDNRSVEKQPDSYKPKTVKSSFQKPDNLHTADTLNTPSNPGKGREEPVKKSISTSYQSIQNHQKAINDKLAGMKANLN